MSHGDSQDKDRPSVGRTLQQARTDAQLTVEEVSASTRVRIPIIQAIENDDFSRCGGEVYARGHIRMLARASGADPIALVDRFNEEHGEPSEPVPAAPVFEAERIRPEPRRPNWTAAMVAAIAAVVAFGAFMLLGGPDDEGDAVADDSAAPPEETADPAPEPDPTGDDEPDPTEQEPDPSESPIAGNPADRVTLRIEASADSWIMVTDANDQEVFQAVMEEGDAETFTDDEQLDLVSGNAGGVEVHVNGRHIEEVGGPGEVYRGSFTTGDPEEG